MRGSRAKAIRREVHGPDGSSRHRAYARGRDSARFYVDGTDGKRKWFHVGGPVRADEKRRAYQRAKERG